MKTNKFAVGTVHETAQGKIEIVNVWKDDNTQMVNFKYLNNTEYSQDVVLQNKLVNLRSNIAKFETRKMATENKSNEVEELKKQLAEAQAEIEKLRMELAQANSVEAPKEEPKAIEFFVTDKDGNEQGPFPTIYRMAKVIGVDPSGLKKAHEAGRACKGFTVIEK